MLNGVSIDIFKYRYIEVNNEKIQLKNDQKQFLIIRDSFAQIILFPGAMALFPKVLQASMK